LAVLIPYSVNEQCCFTITCPFFTCITCFNEGQFSNKNYIINIRTNNITYAGTRQQI
jgi:hypothetical protein